MTFECRCCNPSKIYSTKQSRFVHESSMKRSSTEVSKLTASNVGKLPSKSISSKDADTKSVNSNASRDSRASIRSQAKAQEFRLMVQSQAETLQLSKKSSLSVNPIEMNLNIIFNHYMNSDSGYDDIDLMRKELANYPDLKNYLSDSKVFDRIEEILDRKIELIEDDEAEYGKVLKATQSELNENIRNVSIVGHEKNVSKDLAAFMKTLFKKDLKGEYEITVKSLQDQLEELEQYQLVLVNAKIKALKDEASHRLRLLDHDCAELILEAIKPDVAVARCNSQDPNLEWDMDIIMPSSKKSRKSQ